MNTVYVRYNKARIALASLAPVGFMLVCFLLLMPRSFWREAWGMVLFCGAASIAFNLLLFCHLIPVRLDSRGITQIQIIEDFCIPWPDLVVNRSLPITLGLGSRKGMRFIVLLGPWFWQNREEVRAVLRENGVEA